MPNRTDFSLIEDKVLVEMTLLGNMNAFEELVRRYERAVKDAAYRVTGNRFSAEDAAQDALVCAWMQLSTLREKEKFGGFVCAIARHRAQDYLRRYRASIPPLSLDALLFQVGEMTDDGERLKSELREAVDALKEPVRETVKLRYFEGYSVKEIAARQALPEGTVKWRLSKGRKELRKGYGSMTYPTERPLNERKDGQGANGTMATPWEKRIMEQVERLKLYKLTLDQPGFEKDYLALLPQLLELEESREKNSACADVWWLARTRFPEIAGQKITDEQIGKAALKGRNEEVLRRLISSEIRQEYREPETALAFLRDKCIPYFREEGLQKTLGYAYYLLYGEYLKSDKTREASDALQSALGALKPDDLYYAVAMAESKALRRLAEAPPAEKAAGGRICCGGAEEYRKIEGKWYFWDAWGAAERGFGEQIFRRGEYMGRLFPDPGIPIEGRKWERKRETKRRDLRFGYSHEAEGVTVTTPAGTFSDCAVFCRERRGECASCTTVQTTYCPGVGIVRQKTSSDASSDSAAVGFGWNGEWQLSSYHVEGDDPSLIPLHTGNRFVYTPVKSECEGICYSFENRYEVLFSDGEKAIVEHLFCADRTGYADSFDGLRQKMMYTFSRHSEKKTFGEEQIRELSGIRQKLVARANGIHRQRYAEIAGEVMERIYRTGAARKPEAQAGAEAEWNIFEMVEVAKDGGRITPNRSVYDRFDWGDERYLCMEFRQLSIFDYLDSCTGDFLYYSDKWVPGYTEKSRKGRGYYGEYAFRLAVLPGGTVETPAGVFPSCRLLRIHTEGKWAHFRQFLGDMEYLLAPGIGIVKFRELASREDGSPETVWHLTGYAGKGGEDDYFPIYGQFTRRYEPETVREGFDAATEYTFAEENGRVLLFRNAWCLRSTQEPTGEKK